MVKTSNLIEKEKEKGFWMYFQGSWSTYVSLRPIRPHTDELEDGNEDEGCFVETDPRLFESGFESL